MKPQIVDNSVTILSKAGLGMAMFSLGKILEQSFHLFLWARFLFPHIKHQESLAHVWLMVNYDHIQS